MRRFGAAAIVLGVVVMLIAASGPAEGISLQGHFSDDNGHLFENDIDAIAQAGITKGCNPPANTHYCPNSTVDRGAMAAFLRRALQLPTTNTDHFTDDNNSIFEADINAIAEAGITKGCNPPANTHYCPNNNVDRGAMAAFLKRALRLPTTNTDHFTDDNNSIFEADINAIAEAGITKGCNPPANTHYCPNSNVDRGAMAAFLTRGLGLASFIQQIPMGHHSAMVCSKDGERCRLSVDVSANKTYRITEGWFQVTPSSSQEDGEFNSSGTTFSLTLDGSTVSLSQLAPGNGGGVTTRNWQRNQAFSAGTHTLVGTWKWDGETVQINTITIRAAG